MMLVLVMNLAPAGMGNRLELNKVDTKRYRRSRRYRGEPSAGREKLAADLHLGSAAHRVFLICHKASSPLNPCRFFYLNFLISHHLIRVTVTWDWTRDSTGPEAARILPMFDLRRPTAVDLMRREVTWRCKLIVVRMPANANNGRSRRHLLPGLFARRLSAHVAPMMVPSEAPA